MSGLSLKDVLKTTMQANKNYVDSKGVDTGNHNFGLIWIYWTNNLTLAGADEESAAIALSKYDVICTQTLNLNGLPPTAEDKSGVQPYTAASDRILARAKQLNPKLRRFEYVQSESERTDFKYQGENSYLNEDGSWEGSTAQLAGCTRIYNFVQFQQWFDYFASIGVDGIFFDDWGYDFTLEHIAWQMGYNAADFASKNDVLNKKWGDLIDACHERGLSVITNGGFPSSTGNWYTHLNNKDIIAFESCLISSDGGKIKNGHLNLYNYYTNFYSKGLCAAKSWSLDYFPPNASIIFGQKVITYLMSMALAAGAHYSSIGLGYNEFKAIPADLEPFARGSLRTITTSGNNLVQLKVGTSSLEVQKTNTVDVTLTEEIIDRFKILINGRQVLNFYSTATNIEVELGDDMVEMQKVIETITEDSKKNASSYWRLAIDDWLVKLSYKDYTNYLKEKVDKSSQVSVVEKEDGTYDLVVTYNNFYGTGNSYYRMFAGNTFPEEFEGKTLELGFSGVEFNLTGNAPELNENQVYKGNGYQWPQPDGFCIYINNAAASAVFNPPNNVSSTLGEKGGYAVQFEPFSSSNGPAIYVWMANPTSADKTPLSGTVTLKNVYLIDINEHDEDVIKTWYTNIYPTTINKQSMATSVITHGEHHGEEMVNLVASASNPWGWSAYTFPAEEVIKMRGHKIEIGCASISCDSADYPDMQTPQSTKISLGLSTNVNTMPNVGFMLHPSVNHKSEVFDDITICDWLTVPMDATDLAVGIQSYGFPVGTTVIATGLYLYDLDEDVKIRGVDTTDASLRVCRIKEDVEEDKPSKIQNGLYITDKGRIYCKDLKGEVTEIAGAIFAGAVEAGYTGTPQQFGAALYNLIK